jgi:non-homologous end joining protein Ku
VSGETTGSNAYVGAETGEEVSNEDMIKGYKVDTDTYITTRANSETSRST